MTWSVGMVINLLLGFFYLSYHYLQWCQEHLKNKTRLMAFLLSFKGDAPEKLVYPGFKSVKALVAIEIYLR